MRLPHRDEDLDDRVLEAFREQLSSEARIGAVGRRGYGAVRLKAGEREQPVESDLKECGSAVLWLTSDLCLSGTHRHSFSRCTGRGSRRQASACRGGSVRRSAGESRSRGAGCATRRHESWQRQWGLPRPSLTLVRAGSVVVIKPDDKGRFEADELRRLERQGIGERRTEGHGQIRVNAPEVTRDDKFRVSSHRAEAESSERSDRPVALPCSTCDYAQDIENAAWRSYLARRAEEATATDSARKRLLGWQRSKPSASQLGKMRALLNGARTEDDVQAVREWLEKSGSEDWKGARTKLMKVLNDPFAVLESADLSEECDPKALSQPADPWLDAPPALTRSLCRYSGGHRAATLRDRRNRARRPARAPPRCRDPDAPAGRRGPGKRPRPRRRTDGQIASIFDSGRR